MNVAERRGRFIRYDKQKVLEQIVAGRMSAAAIAASHGITRDMVYSLKHAAKKKHIIRDPVQRLDDLDPVEPRTEGLAREIHQRAKLYRDGDLDDLEFYQEIQRLLA